MTSRHADWGERTRKRSAGTTVELTDEVAVAGTPDQAWVLLSDVPFVAACLPGLEPSSLEQVGENEFRARMMHSVMGMTANWDLNATITPLPAERRIDVRLAGTDGRLGMSMNGNADVAVKGEPGSGAMLAYTANIRVDGSLAAMGGPIIRSVMSDALAGFVAAVGGQETARPAHGLGRLREALARLFRRLRPRAR
jgi:carbon monoxide dehydrogenase subunit G